MSHCRIECRRDSFSGIDPGMLFDSAFNMEVCQLYNFVTHSFMFKINVFPSKDAVVMVGDIFVSNKPPLKLPCLFLYIIMLV